MNKLEFSNALNSTQVIADIKQAVELINPDLSVKVGVPTEEFNEYGGHYERYASPRTDTGERVYRRGSNIPVTIEWNGETLLKLLVAHEYGTMESSKDSTPRGLTCAPSISTLRNKLEAARMQQLNNLGSQVEQIQEECKKLSGLVL